MERSVTHTYSHAMAGQTRYSSTYATSSAFSASANPNEDWTKISDLAERRRIQNRIAQRNYRKKLKRRLEDLERRAGSSSASPEPSHAELPTTPPKDSHPRRSPAIMTRHSSKSSSSHDMARISPEILPLDDGISLFDSSRHLPISSSSSFSNSSYPSTTSYLQHEYHQLPMYQSSQTCFGDYQYPAHYSNSLPPTLPAMIPATYATRNEQLLGDDDLLNPFTMSYASLAGIDVRTSQDYTGSAAHTPPLTDPFSMSQSPDQSPMHFELPLTPISRSQSPNVHLFDFFGS